MWIVLKYKSNEYYNLIKNIKKKIGNKINFYNPKISFFIKKRNLNKYKEVHILGGYAFCYSEEFADKKNVFKIHNTKGLKYLLDGHIHNQTEIKKFIEQCKSNENKDGSLKQDFFYNLKTCRAKFLNGPFANLIFEILEKRKNSIKTAFGEATLIIKKKSNYFYSDVY